MTPDRPHRFADWRFRLAILVEAWQPRRWEFGVTDCAQFAVAAIAAQTGRRLQLPDYAASGRRNAVSGLVGAVQAVAAGSGHRQARRPLQGDVGLFRYGAGRVGAGSWTLGVISWDIDAVWVPEDSGLDQHHRSVFTESFIYAVGG